MKAIAPFIKIVLLILLLAHRALGAVPPAPFVYDEYKYLMNNINAVTPQRILDFLNHNTTSPLATNVRNQWVRWLVKQQQWQDALKYYVPNNGPELECSYLTALYHTGQQQTALAGVKKLWMVGHSQPKACFEIFAAWKKSPLFERQFLWQRIELALIENNNSLIRYLSSKLAPHEQYIVDKWMMLYAQPALLKRYQLATDVISKRAMLSSLKKWVALDHSHALRYWEHIKNSYPFTHDEQQEFYQQVCLDLALDNDKATEEWFNQLDPASFTPRLRAWRIRYELLAGNWQQVKILIITLPENERNTPLWTYWYARALATLDDPQQAYPIYRKLSQQRNYYGFLASYQLNTKPNIPNYPYLNTAVSLANYQTEIRYIKNYFFNKQFSDAILLTRHMLSKVTPPQGYALAKLFAQWRWYLKSLAIANDPAYQNDLALRFPMPYATTIKTYADNYQVSSAFIYAIIRQESCFQDNVKSSAGALGLMQLTLPTATALSKQLKLPFRQQNDLLSPQTNIRLGTAYLNTLSKHFRDHPILIAAAYNAGPHQVALWLQHQPTKQADIWVETLPWKETRVYLKHIVAYDTIYRRRLRQQIKLVNFMRDIKTT